MGALWSHQMSALALPGWAEEGRAEFGVPAWGTAAVEGFLHPSKPWLMFFLHLAQDVSAGQGTAAGAISPPHGLAGPWCSFSITLGCPAWGASGARTWSPRWQGPTGASPN